VNFQQSKSEFLLATTHTLVQMHRDIATGQGRNVNLQLPPFNLPEPLKIIVEDSESAKCLGLWRLNRLRVE
jgi:hypothetical protein